MNASAIVAHYHEVALKGRNRRYFENQLQRNIRSSLAAAGIRRIAPMSGRMIARLDDGADLQGALEALGRVFGLSGFSPAMEVEASYEAMTAAALEMAGQAGFETFRIRARRGNSSFPDTSQRVNEVLGRAVQDATGARVDLKNAQWTCHVELVENTAFAYEDKLPGPGGLPVGVSGKVAALLSGGIDSPVAAWEIAKRGATVDLVHFHGQPYTDPSSVRQATALARRLAPWLAPTGGGSLKLWLIPFGDIQSEIVTSAGTELRIVLYRRFMMRIAEALAKREGALGLVTGESLGQVASQTLPNILAVGEAVKDLPVLRPLSGRDKVEIEALARRIGTYEISIDAHQDCCVLFVPRQVTTHARLPDLQHAESALDVQALVDKALANAELVAV